MGLSRVKEKMSDPYSEHPALAFDQSIASKVGATVEERKKGFQAMIVGFVGNNCLSYIYKAYPEGATGAELEAHIKKRAKEADPDQETFTISNMLTNNFMAYFEPAMKALYRMGQIEAGEDNKYFLKGEPAKEG